MAEEVGEITPVKRKPGRPRKVPVPVEGDVPTAGEPVVTKPEPKKAAPPDPDDPLIGQSCDASWSGIGFSNGSSYRCQDGTIVERIN